MLRKLQGFEASLDGIGLAVDENGIRLERESPLQTFFRKNRTGLITAGSVLGGILLLALVFCIVKKICCYASTVRYVTMMVPNHSWYGGGGQRAPPTTTVVMPQPQPPSYTPQGSAQEWQPLPSKN